MSSLSRISSLPVVIVLTALLGLSLDAHGDDSPTSDSDFGPPEEPVVLRFQWNEPLRYEIDNQITTSFEESSDLRQVYSTRMVIDYRPLSRTHRQLLPHWPLSLERDNGADRRDQNHSHHRALLARLEEVSSGFEEPEALSQPQRSYQLLKNATFSFQISPRGLIRDPRIHPPTSPLVRTTLEEVVHLFSDSHPLLPEEPVAPGAEWHHSIHFSMSDSSVQKTQETEFTYRFARWTPCENNWCAVIEVIQEIRAEALVVTGERELRTSSQGEAKGVILFHPQRGKVLASQWFLDLRGTSRGTEGPSSEELREFYHLPYHTRVEASTRLLSDFGGFDLTPFLQELQ